MNEQKSKAYLELIDQLLSCPQGQEMMIMQTNVELGDKGLLAAMSAVAEQMDRQGNSDADWLRKFAAQLEQASLEEVDARQFGTETLQLVLDTRSDPQTIYSVWEEQQTRFNEVFLTELPTVAAQIFAKNAEHKAVIASILADFGTLINQFELDKRWLNLELGIAAYEQALIVMTKEAMPVEWAQTMHYLASAYKNRLRGNRAENIEKAITAYEQALTVRTQAAMPMEWAQTISNVAIAYAERIQGDHAENIEKAITAYEQALTVITQSAMPVEWAETVNNLANAYKNRIYGDRAQNIEKAIASLQTSSHDKNTLSHASGVGTNH